jgi:hypothetical protein
MDSFDITYILILLIGLVAIGTSVVFTHNDDYQCGYNKGYYNFTEEEYQICYTYYQTHINKFDSAYRYSAGYCNGRLDYLEDDNIKNEMDYNNDMRKRILNMSC